MSTICKVSCSTEKCPSGVPRASLVGFFLFTLDGGSFVSVDLKTGGLEIPELCYTESTPL